MRNGKIIEADLKFGARSPNKHDEEINKSLLSRSIHEIHDWRRLLNPEAENLGAIRWMNTMLSVPKDEPHGKPVAWL